MDNEASQDLKTAMGKEQATYQPIPPYVHRTNAAEHAIITFKNNLLAYLATCDLDYPASE